MGKQSAKKDPTEKARRKLSKAQLALNVAQEELAQMRERGKQAIEKTRLREARRLAKSSQKVERKATMVARAEEKLLAIAGPDRLEKSAQSSPEAAANFVKQRQLDANNGNDAGSPTAPSLEISHSDL